MIVTYYCKKCKTYFPIDYKENEKPKFSIACKNCGASAPRFYGNVCVSKEDPSVSGAIQMMLYAQRPSKTN